MSPGRRPITAPVIRDVDRWPVQPQIDALLVALELDPTTVTRVVIRAHLITVHQHRRTRIGTTLTAVHHYPIAPTSPAAEQ